MKLVYVFNPRHETSYLCRVPLFLARWIVRGDGAFDWWPTLDGAPNPYGAKA